MLHNNDHGVVIVKEDFNDVAARESNTGSWLSPFNFRESQGYHTRSKYFPNILSPGGTEASFTGDTSDYGAIHKVYIFVDHLQ